MRMHRAMLCAIVSMSALAACDRIESGARTANTPPVSTDGRAYAQDAAISSFRADESTRFAESVARDAGVVRMVMATLDPRDAEAKFVAAPKVRLRGEARLNQRVDGGVRIDVELSEGP